MAVILEPLLKEDREMFYSMLRGTYLDGECYAFAIALHRGLGWPMEGLMQGKVIRHAAVRSPDGSLHDVRGFISDHEFGSPFLEPPYVIRAIEEYELFDARTIEDGSIANARRTAELIWPELPWVETNADKCAAFASDIEAVSRKHGLWIRGAVPAQSPLIAAECGEEGGYRLRSTLDGITFTLERYFE